MNMIAFGSLVMLKMMDQYIFIILVLDMFQKGLISPKITKIVKQIFSEDKHVIQ